LKKPRTDEDSPVKVRGGNNNILKYQHILEYKEHPVAKVGQKKEVNNSPSPVKVGRSPPQVKKSSPPPPKKPVLAKVVPKKSIEI
jgi:hypothetical protein